MLTAAPNAPVSQIGVYLRDVGSMGNLKLAAKKAADHGIGYVCHLACWQDARSDRKINALDDVRRVRDAFGPAGVFIWLWGYPYAGREEAFVASMLEVDAAMGGSEGWILDPEKPYKAAVATARKVRATQAKELLRRAEAAIDDDQGLGVTSFGMAAQHPTMPWSQLVGSRAFGAPQLYEVNAGQVDAGIAAWRRDGWNTIIPSVPAYGKRSGPGLHDFLSEFVDGDEDVSGFTFWSWPQLSPAELDVVARWADWLKNDLATLSRGPR